MNVTDAPLCGGGGGGDVDVVMLEDDDGDDSVLLLMMMMMIMKVRMTIMRAPLRSKRRVALLMFHELFPENACTTSAVSSDASASHAPSAAAAAW